MKKKCLSVLLVLCFLFLVGSTTIVTKSYSSDSMTINSPGSYYVKGGTNIKLSGIVCSTIQSYSNDNSFNVTSITDCGGTFYTIPSLEDNYLFVVKDTGSTCGGQLAGSTDTKIDADCYVYSYDEPKVTVTCDKSELSPGGEPAYCNLKVTTSSAGFKSLNLTPGYGENYIPQIVEYNPSSIVSVDSSNGGNIKYTSNKTLKANTEYDFGNFVVINTGVTQGSEFDTSYARLLIYSHYSDSIVTDYYINDYTNIIFPSRPKSTSTSTTSKVNTNSNVKAITTTKAPTTTKADVTSIETTTDTSTSVSTQAVSDGNLVVDTNGEASAKSDDSNGLSGTTAVLLTTFVANMSVAAGIGIVFLAKKIKL